MLIKIDIVFFGFEFGFFNIEIQFNCNNWCFLKIYILFFVLFELYNLYDICNVFCIVYIDKFYCLFFKIFQGFLLDLYFSYYFGRM